MNSVFVRIVRALSSFVNSPGHYAAAITLVLWLVSSRALGLFSFSTVKLNFQFCIFFIVSYWLIGTALHIAEDLGK